MLLMSSVTISNCDLWQCTTQTKVAGLPDVAASLPKPSVEKHRPEQM